MIISSEETYDALEIVLGYVISNKSYKFWHKLDGNQVLYDIHKPLSIDKKGNVGCMVKKVSDNKTFFCTFPFLEQGTQWYSKTK